MRKRPLVKRILMFVLTILVLFSLMTIGVYSVLSHTAFITMKAKDMIPQADEVCELTRDYLSGDLSTDIYRVWAPRSAAGAYLMVFDASGTNIAATEMSENLFYSMQEAIRPYAQRVLNGEQLVISGGIMSYSNTENMLVGRAVYGHDGQTIIGAVFLFKPLTETSAAFASLIVTLFIATASVFLFTIPIIIFFGNKLTRPIKQMRDVAIAMATNNFSVRASELSPDEIGDLGRSLNYLSATLMQTVGELRLEKYRLLRILDGLSEGIVAVDANGELTHANPAILGFYGMRISDIQTRMDAINDESVWQDFDAVIHDNSPLLRNVEVNDVVLRMSLSPLRNEAGEAVGAVGLFTDITESERLEQTRREYVANVSHELRTPLTALRGLIEPLRDGLVENPQDRQRYYEYILRETMRLSRLIDDLLELSRLQSNPDTFIAEPFDLCATLLSVASQYTILAHEEDIQFIVGEGAEQCPVALGNADRVSQVLIILLDNAIKFTPQSGTVSLDAEWDDQEVRVIVRDTGAGVAQQDLPYIFERFYKADKAHSGSGTGLGLSIAKEIMGKLGQRIYADNWEMGAQFVFTLKRVKSDEQKKTHLLPPESDTTTQGEGRD
ncbi:MAG: ATP-binding protein [Christensenellales bacterium]|jgi:signal transduction histidine kinase